jgi:hypothetical protein
MKGLKIDNSYYSKLLFIFNAASQFNLNTLFLDIWSIIKVLDLNNIILLLNNQIIFQKNSSFIIPDNKNKMKNGEIMIDSECGICYHQSYKSGHLNSKMKTHLKGLEK